VLVLPAPVTAGESMWSAAKMIPPVSAAANKLPKKIFFS
jgi:hypothetical protein